MLLLDELRSRLQYKIIIPFLVLTLLVALGGVSVALLASTGSAQERLNNQLAHTAREASDLIVQVERSNLAFLRDIAFAAPNPFSGAPAVADALAQSDAAGLGLALEPFFLVGVERGLRVDRLIAFDRAGNSVVDWERSPADPAGRSELPSAELGARWSAPLILSGLQDGLGDKYAGLEHDGERRYLYTVAPVSRDGVLVGGVVAAINLDSLLPELAGRTQAAFVTIYRAADGAVFATSLAGADDAAQLGVRDELLPLLGGGAPLERGVFDTVEVNLRGYQLAYAPLLVRGSALGIFSVALTSDYVVGPWSDIRSPLLVVTTLLMLAIIALGVMIAGQISSPLRELAAVARAVTGGDLNRRSGVRSRDEVGVLATSFNAMTGHLLDLYGAVRAEAGQRAAIFESIADGIIVASTDGAVVMANPALRELLSLAADDPLPARFDDLGLERLSGTPLRYGGASSSDLFRLGERIIRLVRSPIRSEQQEVVGLVYVLQDMTAEVAVDRAKTNFIATISHELRTPLTVIGGAADLLLSGASGPPSEEQRPLLDSIRGYTRTTTNLINNIILAANLDAGTVEVAREPLALADVLWELERPIRRAAGARGLRFVVALPDDLPEVLADAVQLPAALRQLLDNACRYTERGAVTLTAVAAGGEVRIDIADTGPGIEPALQSQLFTRFTRGPQGINSPERGIGLGLALSRELIELQHGRLWLAESTPSGSVFSIALEHSNAADRTADTAAAARA